MSVAPLIAVVAAAAALSELRPVACHSASAGVDRGIRFAIPGGAAAGAPSQDGGRSSSGGEAAGEETVRRVRPLTENELAQHDVVLQPGKGDARTLLSWKACELPLSVPPERVAVGMLDEHLLVVLVGGIRHSLDVYLLEASGAITRHATDGGRRLSASFNGFGSWPVAIGRSVFVFGFEKNGRIELRAVGLRDQVFATRSLPVGASGFDVAVDSGTHKIRVVPRGVEERALEFAHPEAPRIECQQNVLEFDVVRLGETRARSTMVRNPSSRPIDVTLRAEGAFQASIEAARIVPGGSVPVTITFAPGTAAEYRGRLVVRIDGRDQGLVLPLRGQGAREVAETADLPAASSDRRAGDRATATAGFESPRTGRPSSRAAVPATGQKPPAENPPRTAPPESPAAVPPPLSDHGPTLTREGDSIVVRGRAGETVVLALVSLCPAKTGPAKTGPAETGPAKTGPAETGSAETGPQPDRQLVAWRAELSVEDGVLCVPAALVFGEHRAAGLVALRRGPFGVRQSNLLTADADPERPLR